MKLITDVVQCICEAADRETLLNLSLVTKEFRYASIPAVFREVQIIADWETVGPQVNFILENCDEVCKFVRQFRFIACEKPLRNFARKDSVNMENSPEFPSAICVLISKMTQLKRLGFDVPDARASSFEMAFAAGAVSLATVTVLRLSPYAEFLVKHCPAVTDVETCRDTTVTGMEPEPDTSAALLLINAVRDRPIVRFGLVRRYWRTSITNAIVNTIPFIRDLVMVAAEYPGGFDTHLLIFSRLTKLERLWLGHNPCPGISFHVTRLSHLHLEKPVKSKVGKGRRGPITMLSARACPKLNEMWVLSGSKYVHVKVKRKENGEIKLVDKCFWKVGEDVNGYPKMGLRRRVPANVVATNET
ncbi:hypothetical protein BD410DRAFT_787412 [Rickenella mellea]|uniref:F-box domain-containing protein n=1 Tax=Rickenella mellea TaxID=50990 RepID=A0A4Y7Q8B4_9AGAM|nr:hypothetical protein BD410DRAFT_787412 [Rickenella mellea]